jgi:hypothetical protein
MIFDFTPAIKKYITTNKISPSLKNYISKNPDLFVQEAANYLDSIYIAFILSLILAISGMINYHYALYFILPILYNRQDDFLGGKNYTFYK